MSRGRSQTVGCIKHGQRNPLVFLEGALAWITQRDRSDGAVRPAGPEKECDQEPLNEFCRPGFPSQVRDACGLRGSSGRSRKEGVSATFRIRFPRVSIASGFGAMPSRNAPNSSCRLLAW